MKIKIFLGGHATRPPSSAHCSVAIRFTTEQLHVTCVKLQVRSNFHQSSVCNFFMLAIIVLHARYFPMILCVWAVPYMWLDLPKPGIIRKNWNPFYSLTWKPHSSTIQTDQWQGWGWPGLLSQAAFVWPCKFMTVLYGVYGATGAH